jgi:dimethylaniline monooxygenase (N-oxide forming)
MKIAVIGCGAAGLAAIKNSINFGCEVVAFEQSDKIGGTWVYNERIGKDKNGLEVHSSMYQNLTTNLPIELMCYPNEPFPANEKSFVSSKVVLNYYEEYADKYNLRDYMKFEHYVVNVKPNFDDSWDVLSRNLQTGEHKIYNFDGLLICNGHFHSPFIPKYQGREMFKGKQMHSHNYRSPEVFKDETILVIGGNFSAVDIVQQTASLAKSITWSHHLEHEPDIKSFGVNVNQKPDVMKMTSESVEFTDGTTLKFSMIIYCTGYVYKFPFLSVDCGISTNEEYVKPLFKHCININRPTMAFIGLPNLICPNQLFDLQARFTLTFMMGRKKLPSKNEMMKELEADLEERWKRRGLPPRKAHLMGPDIQDVYYADLARTADIPPIQPVIPQMHKYTNLNRNKDFINFRCKKYKIINDNTFKTFPL